MRIKGIVLLIRRFIFSAFISFSCFLIVPDAFNFGIELPSEHPAQGGNCSFPGFAVEFVIDAVHCCTCAYDSP